MEAPSNSNASKQNLGQDGKHLSYAQITQKKKEEREAKEAADRAAAAAAATHNLNHGPVDGACSVDPSTKKIVKDQVAVKQNFHGVNSSCKDADHIKSSVISSPSSGSSSLKTSNLPASDCSKVPATSPHPASGNSSSAAGPGGSKGGNSSGSVSNASAEALADFVLELDTADALETLPEELPPFEPPGPAADDELPEAG
jgi:hypothetical protein